MPALTLTLFGPPQLARDGEPAHLRSRKCLALLAYLAITGRTHRRDSLASLLWPESDPTRAQNSLRYTLSLLRRALDRAWLVVDRETIGLDGSEREAMDVARFRDLLSQCETHGHAVSKACPRCLPPLEEAVELYRGDFMAGFTLRDSPQFDDWQALESEALQRGLAGALERLAEGYAAQGDDVERAMAHAQRWAGLHPLEETAHRALMRLYAGSGRQSAALRQYDTCQQVLRDQLGMPPSEETRDLYQAIRGGRMPQVQVRPPVVSAVPSRPRHNLPLQPTAFVGREEELDQIAQHLADPACHLLTVVGPGGMGKSRLAIQAAEEHLPVFSDGVWFVPLAPVGSVDLLPSAIMEALDVPRSGRQDPQTQLLNYLRERHLLLILDNFEHLLEGTALVAEMLAGASGLKLLVTSRERLSLRGEWLLPLQGMAVPEEGDIVDEAAAVVEEYSAVELFVQCVRQVQPEFSLAAAGADAVSRICQLAGGMPLAIELAAPWAREMRCRDISEAMERDMGILATTLRDMPARHRSMRAVFDRSWDLLTREEREVLEGLSVFRGGFRWQAANEVAGANLVMLSSLVDRSWLRATPSGRYEMHELARQYCGDMLDAGPTEEGMRESEQVRDRHSRYYGAFLREREEPLHAAGQAEALREILEEADNVWATWGWAVERGQVETIGECVEALGYVGGVRGWYHELNQALEKGAATLRQRLDHTASQGERSTWEQTAIVLAEVLSEQVALDLGPLERAIKLARQALALLEGVERGAKRDRVRIYAEIRLGWRLWMSGDGIEGKQLLHKALALADEVGDPWGRELAFESLGTCARNEGRRSEAEGLLGQAIAIADETGEQRMKASSLNNLSAVVLAQGEYQRARMLAEESLRIFQELGERWGICASWVRLGGIARRLEDYDLAKLHYQKGLAIADEINDPDIKYECLLGQAGLAFALGQHEEAKQLYEESLALAREEGSLVKEGISLVNLGQAALALGDAQQAREFSCQGLEATMRAGILPTALEPLLGLASLLAEEAKPERAVELLALVLHHPAIRQADKDKAENLLADLQSELSPEAFTTATARGRARELEDVAAEILEGR